MRCILPEMFLLISSSAMNLPHHIRYSLPAPVCSTYDKPQQNKTLLISDMRVVNYNLKAIKVPHCISKSACTTSLKLFMQYLFHASSNVYKATCRKPDHLSFPLLFNNVNHSNQLLHPYDFLSIASQLKKTSFRSRFKRHKI